MYFTIQTLTFIYFAFVGLNNKSCFMFTTSWVTVLIRKPARQF